MDPKKGESGPAVTSLISFKPYSIPYTGNFFHKVVHTVATKKRNENNTI